MASKYSLVTLQDDPKTQRTEPPMCKAKDCPLYGTFGGSDTWYCTFHSSTKAEETDEVTMRVKEWFEVWVTALNVTKSLKMAFLSELCEERKLGEEWQPKMYVNKLGRDRNEKTHSILYASRILRMVLDRVKPKNVPEGAKFSLSDFLNGKRP